MTSDWSKFLLVSNCDTVIFQHSVYIEFSLASDSLCTCSLLILKKFLNFLIMFYVVSYLVPVSLYQHLITSYFRKPINNWERCPSLQFLLSVSFFIPLVPFSFLLAFYLFKSISAISLLLFDLSIKASICFHVFLFGFWARCLSHLIQFKKKKKNFLKLFITHILCRVQSFVLICVFQLIPVHC